MKFLFSLMLLLVPINLIVLVASPKKHQYEVTLVSKPFTITETAGSEEDAKQMALYDASRGVTHDEYKEDFTVLKVKSK
jgi:hypothetical protein